MSRPSPSGPWRAIVIDDEPLARQSLSCCSRVSTTFVIVAECGHGAEGVDAIRRETPDVLFLDVQMPGLDAFDVLKRLGRRRVAAIIFVTAFDRYALRAFDHHALDYLLKPFSDERFALVIERTRARLRERARLDGGLSAGPSNASAARVRGPRRWPDDRGATRRHPLDRGGGLLRATSPTGPHAPRAGIAAGPSEGVAARLCASPSLGDCARLLHPGDRAGLLRRSRLTLDDGTVLKVSRTYRAGVVSALEEHVR